MHVERQYNRFELALMETQGVSGDIHHARLDDPDSVRQLRQRSRDSTETVGGMMTC